MKVSSLISTVLILACVVNTVSVNAQAPGYRGKTFSLGLHFGVTPDFTTLLYDKNPQALHYDDASPASILIIRTFYGGDAEYVVSEKVSLAASYSLSRMAYSSSNDYYDYSTGNAGDINHVYKVKNSYADFAAKIYYNGGIAPLGSYYKLGMGLSNSNYTLNINELVINSGSSSSYRNIREFDGSVGSMYLLIGFGKSRVIKDHIIIDLSNEIRINLNSSPFSLFDDDDNYNIDNSFIVKRLKFTTELFALKMSVRGLLF